LDFLGFLKNDELLSDVVEKVGNVRFLHKAEVSEEEPAYISEREADFIWESPRLIKAREIKDNSFHQRSMRDTLTEIALSKTIKATEIEKVDFGDSAFVNEAVENFKDFILNELIHVEEVFGRGYHYNCLLERFLETDEDKAVYLRVPTNERDRNLIISYYE